MKRKSSKTIVGSYIKMWPREALDVQSGNKPLPAVWDLLRQPGVYILYRDNQPYYVGRATKSIYARMTHHARKPQSRYYNFWNFFSAFIVPQAHIHDVEGILIAAFPTENSATPRFRRLRLPLSVAKLIHNRRLITEKNSEA